MQSKCLPLEAARCWRAWEESRKKTRGNYAICTNIDTKIKQLETFIFIKRNISYGASLFFWTEGAVIWVCLKKERGWRKHDNNVIASVYSIKRNKFKYLFWVAKSNQTRTAPKLLRSIWGQTKLSLAPNQLEKRDYNSDLVQFNKIQNWLLYV